MGDARAPAALSNILDGVAGQGDDGHVAVVVARLAGTDPPGRLDAVHLGHLNVHEDQIEVGFLQDSQCLHAVFHQRRSMTESFEQRSGDDPIDIVVVRDQDVQGMSRSGFGLRCLRRDRLDPVGVSDFEPDDKRKGVSSTSRISGAVSMVISSFILSSRLRMAGR